MTVDTIKRRLVEEIKLRGYEDKYIDRGEEREILQLAITLGVTIESAQAALVEVCAEHGYVQETAVFRAIRAHLDAVAGAGPIARREFDAVFEQARASVQGKKSDRAVKAMVVAVMEDAGNRVRKGWFRNWYADLKRELGV